MTRRWERQGRKLELERRPATVQHLFIDVPGIMSDLITNPDSLVIVVVVRVVCGVVGLHLGQRRADVAESHAVEAVLSATERHLALDAASRREASTQVTALFPTTTTSYIISSISLH